MERKKSKKIIAVIPARGGSKRIPKKNIKRLAGRPLIAWTIEAAKKSKYIDRVIISTDDEEITKVSKKWGAEVINRPKDLATDTAKTMDAIFHLLDILKKEKYQPGIIVLLQPTSPLRTFQDIDSAIELFLNKKCGSVISVFEAEFNFWWAFGIKSDYLKPFFGWEKFFSRSQDLPKLYMPNGAIYIAAPETLKKYNSFYTKENILPYIMPKERSVDIDYEIDFKLTELLFKNERNKNRKKNNK